MSETIDWGGQAFPSEGGVDSGLHPDPGMSLRDWLAGQAIPAIIERCGADSRAAHETLTDYFARKSYEVADAMLIARKGSL